MIRLHTRWLLFGLILSGVVTPDASAQFVLRPLLSGASEPASPIQGELHGIVRDDRGKPIPGAVVSALGSTSVFAVSDSEGRFAFRPLPAGPYLVRAHLKGYLPERGRIIQVSPAEHSVWTIALTRRDPDPNAPAVLAAGVGPTEAAPPATDNDDDHGEVAWRLRHARRSVLKDAEMALAGLDGEPSSLGDSLAGLGRAVGTSARLASSVLSDMPLNGQINLLATTWFERPQDLFTSNVSTPQNVAYMTLAVPTSSGEWAMRGSITQGDLASWILAGSYKRSASANHAYEAGLSYSMQRYLGGNAEALAAMRDGSRNVGAMHAYDNWKIAPRLAIGYGAEYASYDYLDDPGLLSPKASVTVQPLGSDPLKLRVMYSHRETAPGAEEFLPTTMGPWLPPVRTFSSVSRHALTPERLDHVELAAEREWSGNVVIGLRAFQQQVEDQAVTLFGVSDIRSAVGHYQVGTAGDFNARGWTVSFSRTMDRVRAAIDYTQVSARWGARSWDEPAIMRVARAAVRDDNETVHDLTASVETVVAPTATRFYLVYKVSDGFAAADAASVPRFDVQVSQALPFLNFTNTRWEMLVAVRTLFREDPLDGSVYDELLVVRPPKRVVGGVTVRF